MDTATSTPLDIPTMHARSGPTFGRVVAAEWTKLASLRSPWWVAGVTVVVAGLITYLSARASATDPGFEPLGSLTTGLALAQVGPLVLGVLVGTGEFRTGGFRTTFTAVPRRWPVLAAQVLVVTAFALLLGVSTTAACVLGILPSAMSRRITVDVASADAVGPMLGTVVLLVGLALFGQALGALLRRTVPVLVVGVFGVLVLPVVLTMATDPGTGPAAQGPVGDLARTTLVGTLTVLTPGGAAQLLTTSASTGPMDGAPDLGPVGGGLVLAAWILVPMVAAAVRLRTSDVR